MASPREEASAPTAPADGERPRLRLGLIGCGRLGAGYYLPAIAAAEGVELASFAETDLGRSLDAREITQRLHGPDVRICPNARVLLSSATPDAVIICTEPGSHPEQARLAAEAGIPALVEKPPAVDAAATRELVTLAPQPRIAFNRRYAVGSGVLDALRGTEGPAGIELELSFRRARWRPHTAQPDALADAGSHLVDLALRIARPTASPPGVRAVRLGPRAAQAELRLGEVQATISCAINRSWRERVRVQRAGEVVGVWGVGGPLAGLRSRLNRHPDPLLESITAQVSGFAAAAAGDDDGILATAAEGLRVMLVIEAIRRSAAEGGRWVEPELWEPQAGTR